MKLRLFIPCLLLLGALVQGCYTPEKVKTVDDLQNGQTSTRRGYPAERNRELPSPAVWQ